MEGDEEEDSFPATPSSPGALRWNKVRQTVQSVTLWKRVTKKTATALSSTGEAVDAGSLTSFITGNTIKNACENAAAEVVEPPESSPSTVSRPAGTPPMRTLVRPSLAWSPRRRVQRLGDRISAKAPRVSARCTPLPEPEDGHFPHPLRWRSPLSSAAPTPMPRLSEDAILLPVAPPVSPQLRRGWRRELATPNDVSDERQNTHFTLSIAQGFKFRPKDSLHPMLASVVKAEGDDSTEKKIDILVEDEGVHISQRLEKLRSKELRRGTWVQQADVTSDRHVLLQESPRPQALATARQLLTEVQQASAPNASAAQVQVAHQDGTRTVADFRRFISLVNQSDAQELPPDAFMPLMFWLGITHKRRAALAVFRLAFGPGSIPANSILQLSSHCNVQLQLARSFQLIARKESFHHLSEYLTDQRRLREWFSLMPQDVAGRVGIIEVSGLLAQLEVPFDKKQLFRFLSSFTEVYNQFQLKLDGASRAAEMKNRLTYNSFCALLSRIIITWCILQTLDLVDPPNKARVDPLENALPKSVELNDHEHLEAGEDPKVIKRWAEIHRQILVSLLVNHRFWGRESRSVLASMSPPKILRFGQTLSHEGWIGLFQRVRAQGMASTFPEDDEERDPHFLQKKALSSVDTAGKQALE